VTGGADIVIERMRAEDLAAAEPLFRSLGYEIPAEDLRSRFAAITRRDAHAAFVARDADGGLLGLIHVYIRAALEKPVEAVIQSLVVAEAARRRGIGKRLVREAERWAHTRGVSSISLHTQLHRSDAEAFYASDGFAETAQARLMRKKL